LLQIFTDYLRKELKVPLYSALYDEQVLREETANVFKENPSLEGKLAKLKTIFNKVMDLIKTSEKTNVSYGVFEGFSTLAKTAVKEYRGLEVLRVVKSSFEPSFEDSAALK